MALAETALEEPVMGFPAEWKAEPLFSFVLPKKVTGSVLHLVKSALCFYYGWRRILLSVIPVICIKP